jgi:hypothetical protein
VRGRRGGKAIGQGTREGMTESLRLPDDLHRVSVVMVGSGEVSPEPGGGGGRAGTWLCYLRAGHGTVF